MCSASPLKINAAATQFPITQARGIRAFASADFRRRIRGSNLHSLAAQKFAVRGGRQWRHGIFGSRRHTAKFARNSRLTVHSQRLDITVAAPILYTMTIASDSPGRLTHLGVLRFTGADALPFLQGQISN